MLGAELLVYAKRMSGSIRHVEGALRTLWWLGRERPREIFLQNSFVLLLVCVAYRHLSFGRLRLLVADCHNKSLKRRMTGSLAPLFWALKKWSFASVDLAIVSNAALLDEAELLKVRAMPLVDPLPDITTRGKPRASNVNNKPYVLFVCSHEPDEPTDMIAGAARALVASGEIEVVVTGAIPDEGPISELRALEGVHLPSFVPRAEYEALMMHASAVAVLTEDDDCLCCGAYEAITCRRPTLLFRHEIARSVFGDGVHYVEPDHASLLAGLRDLVTNGREMVPTHRPDLEVRERFDREFAEVRRAIDSR